MPLRKDLTDRRFGRLTVISSAGRTKTRHGLWNVLCDCGEQRVVWQPGLITGQTQSCGCRNRDITRAARTKHGGAYTAEYSIWGGIKKRCTNQNYPEFQLYGGRGITVCERWLTFENFLADMGPRPSSKHSIDRINNNGNYEPGNCRWATARQQRMNQRRMESVIAERGWG